MIHTYIPQTPDSGWLAGWLAEVRNLEGKETDRQTDTAVRRMRRE